MRQLAVPDDKAAQTSDAGSRTAFEIVESASDPNRPWQLIIKDAAGTEYRRIGFKSYGDAWHAAERRKSEDDDCQPNLPTESKRQQDRQRSEYLSDIMTWSERQAGLLRRIAAGENVADLIDWDNVVDEIEAAGRRQLTQLRSLLVEALACLLKVEAWPLSPEVPRWRTEALGFQREATAILAPTMRRRIDINEFYFKALRRIPRTMDGQEPQPFPTECPITLDDLLRD
jgi:uncharacterized protein DUF29